MTPIKRSLRCKICGFLSTDISNAKGYFMVKFPLNETRCRQWVKAAGQEDYVYVPIEKLHALKYPDILGPPDASAYEEDNEQQHRRQQLINFGHAQWGFNNWNWAVTKQELDFVELVNGKYCAGVVAFVSITVKSFDLHRENIGYATSTANTKGFAIYKSRKCAVTNALRETLLSFGGSVASELLEQVESQRTELAAAALAPPALPPDPLQENNQNNANKIEPKNAKNNTRKDDVAQNMRSPHPVKNNPVAPVANAPRSPPVARAQPMPCNIPAAPRAPLPAPPRQPPPHQRPSSNDAKLEGMTEEEARAERKRRQRLAQEEFRMKQMMKNESDEKQDFSKNTSSLDDLMLGIPTQDIVIQETGESVPPRPEKRPSPAPEASAKRRASLSKLDIIQAD